jgi:hypothetical protein
MIYYVHAVYNVQSTAVSGGYWNKAVRQRQPRDKEWEEGTIPYEYCTQTTHTPTKDPIVLYCTYEWELSCEWRAFRSVAEGLSRENSYRRSPACWLSSSSRIKVPLDRNGGAAAIKGHFSPTGTGEPTCGTGVFTVTHSVPAGAERLKKEGKAVSHNLRSKNEHHHWGMPFADVDEE